MKCLRFTGTDAAGLVFLAWALVLVVPSLHAQVRGSIEVNSTPAGARVFLDGDPQGFTPLTIEDLAPGPYTVRLERRGFRVWQEWVPVESDRKTRVDADLVPSAGTIVVSSNASDPEVFVRLRPGGAARWIPANELTVPPGRYTFRFRAFGYHEKTAVITVEDERTTTIVLEFDPVETVQRPAATLSRDRFHPRSPGEFSSVVLDVEVNAPVEAILEIMMEPGILVHRERLVLNQRRTRVPLSSIVSAHELDVEYEVVLKVPADDHLFRETLSFSSHTGELITPRSSGAGSPGVARMPIPESRKGRTLLLGLTTGATVGESPFVSTALSGTAFATENTSATLWAFTGADTAGERPGVSAGGSVLMAPSFLDWSRAVRGGLRGAGFTGTIRRDPFGTSGAEAGVPVRMGIPGGFLALLVEPGVGLYGNGLFPKTPRGFLTSGLYHEAPRVTAGVSTRVGFKDSDDLQVNHALEVIVQPGAAPLHIRAEALGGDGETLVILLGIAILR